jgi:hypothetical protein
MGTVSFQTSKPQLVHGHAGAVRHNIIQAAPVLVRVHWYLSTDDLFRWHMETLQLTLALLCTLVWLDYHAWLLWCLVGPYVCQPVQPLTATGV